MKGTRELYNDIKMIPVVKYWPFRTNRNITRSQYEPKRNKGMNLPQEKND